MPIIFFGCDFVTTIDPIVRPSPRKAAARKSTKPTAVPRPAVVDPPRAKRKVGLPPLVRTSSCRQGKAWSTDH